MVRGTTLKTLFLTGYARKNKALYISNGFSYFRNQFTDAEDFFYSVESTDDYQVIRQLIKEFDQIYASFVFTKQLLFLKDLIDERWTIGGPALNQSQDILEQLTCTKCFGTYEAHIGQPEYSICFSNYWEKLTEKFPDTQHIHYGMSIGHGCYWNKCTFCNFDNFPTKYATRPSIESIPEFVSAQKYKQHIYTGIDSTLARQIQPLATAANVVHKRNAVLHTYIRLDEAVLVELEKCADLRGLLVMVGPEVFAQRGIDIIQKGINIQNLPRLVELMERGLSIQINLIHNWNFFDKEMYEESIEIYNSVKRTKKTIFREQVLVLTHKLICNWYNPFMVQQLQKAYGGEVRDVRLSKLDLSEVSGVQGKNIWPVGDSKIYNKKLMRALIPHNMSSLVGIYYQVL